MKSNRPGQYRMRPNLVTTVDLPRVSSSPKTPQSSEDSGEVKEALPAEADSKKDSPFSFRQSIGLRIRNILKGT